MEFSLLRKISVYTTGVSFFITTIISSIFLCISGYMKYIKKEDKLESDKKIDVLEKFYIKSYFLTLFFFILAIIFWWEFLVYQVTLVF